MVGHRDPYRLLSAAQLWMIYRRTPDVRAAVDAIARRIATWAWTVEIEGIDLADPEYDEALEACSGAKRFLAAPNSNGETWQELITKLVTDVLVYEHGAIEQVFDRLEPLPVPGGTDVTFMAPVKSARLVELVALNGATVVPASDDFGRLVGYYQDLSVLSGSHMHPDIGRMPFFGREQVMTLCLFPNTSGPPAPLIETLVNEIITLLRSGEHGMLSSDADEIPPGILVLTGIAGKAADAAKTDLQALKGKHHKIRVITNPDPKGTGAHWVELRRAPKDLQLLELCREVRRTVWRVFGVMPVEMGATEDVPRAVGEVQLEVGTSHLVEPILDLLEAKLNARVVPLLVGDQFAGRVALRFDREAKLSPAEQKAKAETLVALVQEGVLTRNEARSEIDQGPLLGGDIATITVGNTLVRLVSLASPDAPDAPEDDGDGGDGGPGESNGGDPLDAEDEGPGEAGEEDVEDTRAYMTRRIAAPSAWPSANLFKGFRTLDLNSLAESVSEYSRVVEPIYKRAADEVLADISAIYSGTLTSDGYQQATNAVDRALVRLLEQWSLATVGIYRRVVKSARDRAADYTALPVMEDWEDRATAYGARAIGYLNQSGGLIVDLRMGINAILAAATQDGGETRAIKKVPPWIVQGAAEGLILSAVAEVFSSAEHRINNWAGKLVELAADTLSEGMAQGAQGVEEWHYEWVAVGDDASCATCATEGARGIRPASQLQVLPGGSTQCRANCRCVLVYWTRAEVNSGTAQPLSGALPGNQPL